VPTLALALPYKRRNLIKRENRKMTIRLIKQNQKSESNQKAVAEPSPNQVLLTTQGWVQEFKARKAKGFEAIPVLGKQS